MDLMTPLHDLHTLGRTLGPLAHPDHPLGARTTYRVGGTAALFVEAVDEDQLLEVARAVAGSAVPVLVVGKGSNLLVADRGFGGLVVSLGSGFESLDIDGERVRAGAALSLPVLARRTAAAGLHGLEWAVGVPGSVGGAVRMNAGGHGSERLGLGYRRSGLAATDVVVAAVHRLERGRPEEGRALIDEIVRWRRANQPGGSNAGSVFSNPPGDSAGRLIDSCGLKGFRIGTAEVSPRHANFIQADTGGSADDVRRVIDHVRSVVAATTGVVLQTEVQMIGFPPDPEGRP